MSQMEGCELGRQEKERHQGKVNEKGKLMEMLMRKNSIGHILPCDGRVKDVAEGRMERKHPLGRTRISELEDLKKKAKVEESEKRKGMEKVESLDHPLGGILTTTIIAASLGRW